MKFRFDFVYHAGLVALFLVVGWSVWAEAQGVSSTATFTDAAAGNPSTLLKMNLQTNALTFGLDRVEILQETPLFGQPLWKYIASLIYIILAFFVAWLLDFIINGWIKRLAAKTETKYDDLILELVRGPVKVVAFVIFLNIGLGIFEWPPRAELILSRLLIVVVACSVTYVVLKLIDLLLGVWREKIVSPQDKVFAQQLFPIMRKAAKVVIIIAAAMLTADNLGIKITSLLAGLSVGGLALGLAAQDTVANLFGAVAIFMDKPFHIGDRIKVDVVDGTVESIGLRSTGVRNLDGHHVTIPNKLMGNAIITNVTRRPNIKTEMNLSLTFGTSADKVKRATAILEEIYRANPKTADLIVSFNRFGDSALNIFIIHVWGGTDAKLHLAEMQELNLKIKERFDAEKIDFAFPTRTIHITGEAGK
jgi:MscS family membrane protein